MQITTDALDSYAPCLKRAFGDRMDYAQEEKQFQAVRAEGPEWQKFRVSPLVGVERTAIYGKPNLRTSTVAHAEKFFLTVGSKTKGAPARRWPTRSFGTTTRLRPASRRSFTTCAAGTKI